MPTTPIIRLDNVHHAYNADTEKPVIALQGVTFDIHEGEFLVILGHNGSGKSTLAKHLNGLLLPTQGDVYVRSWNTKDKTHVRNIRSTVGMVFQIPDNQLVATIVEEDVAFGPENLGIHRDEIVRRVDWSLDRVNMNEFRYRAPHLLSGGQKQRVCIAGTLAMQPQVLVLDEATSMLDPLGRKEVLDVAHRMNKVEGVTVIAITHHMEEAVNADRVVIMANGKVEMVGAPREIFRQAEILQTLHMHPPILTQFAQAIHAIHPNFAPDVLTSDEFLAQAQALLPNLAATEAQNALSKTSSATMAQGEPIIHVSHLGHYYMYDTPLQVKAVNDISFEVHKGEIFGIIGHTGSGKSTAIQHLNALLRPHEGDVIVLGNDLSRDDIDTKTLRKRVGLVFQNPESQLFEHYVGDDIAYGPRNLKLSREEVRERVRQAMEDVGLGFEEFKDRMTFSLSGGQMRRVALAGVLALQPEVLVLDEPTSGLDPENRRNLLQRILKLSDRGVTLVIISHNMDELAQVCDRMCVLANGRTIMQGTPREIFARAHELREEGLDVPQITNVMHQLGAETILNIEEGVTFFKR
jgi:energy-coupling factor transport system ATP-binding protein